MAPVLLNIIPIQQIYKNIASNLSYERQTINDKKKSSILYTPCISFNFEPLASGMES